MDNLPAMFLCIDLGQVFEEDRSFPYSLVYFWVIFEMSDKIAMYRYSFRVLPKQMRRKEMMMWVVNILLFDLCSVVVTSFVSLLAAKKVDERISLSGGLCVAVKQYTY